MHNDSDNCYKVCITDSLKLLTEEGITNVCEKYGPVKKITFLENPKENTSYVEFEDAFSANKIVEDKLVIPTYLTINLMYDYSNEHIKNLKFIEDTDAIENSKVQNSEVIENPKKTNINDEATIEVHSIYFGPNVSISNLLEESEQLKKNEKKKVAYNLENDNLFGKPLNSKWEKFEKVNFELNNLSYYKRFENCTGGEIKVEKKLSPNIFTGWTTIFNDGENVKDILKIISNDIESSDVLNIDNLKRGNLVGAFDSVTNLYGRGYVLFVAGNSVNVALSDYGRVINTIKIRKLPEKLAQIPAYAFKVYTKNGSVQKLEEKPYIFKVLNVQPQRVVLILFDGDREIKVQLKDWQPYVEESGVPYINFKSGSFAEILKLKDMNSVYLRSREKDQFEFLFSFWNSLAYYCYLNPQYLNREPLYGEIVGFKSTISTNYVRGRIHKYLGDDMFCVKHMDDPLKEIIKKTEMIELQFQHKSMPVSFLKVGLKDALPYPIQYEARQLIDHISDARLLVKFDESKLEGWKYVSLQLRIVKENLNEMLFNLTEPSWLKKLSTDQRLESDFCDYNYLLKNKLENNSVVKMRFVMYHDGIFYMRDNNFGKSFILLSNMIKEYCSLNLHPYLPHNDELCLGKYPDGQWYRIICDELKPGELTQVHSVDLGNVAYLNSKDMKKLPVELLFHPSHVYLCILDTSKTINVHKLNQMVQLENNIDFEFTVLKNIDQKNHYLIKCPLLENILE